MNYRNLSDLGLDLYALGSQLPPDLDLVAGVPRSGLLAAQILALYRNLPVTDIDGLTSGYVMESGPRGQEARARLQIRGRAKVLVIDDSLWSGKQLAEVRRRISAADLPYEVFFAVAYIIPGAEKKVDFFCEVVPLPRVFEWNVLHHLALGSACVDLDGILCRDPEPFENDDGPKYRHFINTVAPIIIPRERIGAIVTARLEKYRQSTESWLQRQSIQYDHLFMLDLADGKERAAVRPHAKFKAKCYLRQKNATLFIESSQWQAQEISARTGKPVLCWDTREMVSAEPTIHHATRPLRKGTELGRRLLRRFFRRGRVSVSGPSANK